MATALLNGVKMNSPKGDVKEPFKFIDAWEVLRCHSKFLAETQNLYAVSEKCSKETKSDAGRKKKECHSDSDDETIHVPEKKERLKGRKAAEVEFLKTKHQEEKLKLASTTFALQQKRDDEIQRHNDIALFTAAVDRSPEAVEFFRICRKRVLDNLNEEDQNKKHAAKRMCKDCVTLSVPSDNLASTSTEEAPRPKN